MKKATVPIIALVVYVVISIIYTTILVTEMQALRAEIVSERIEMIKLIDSELETVRLEQLNILNTRDSINNIRIDSIKSEGLKLKKQYEKINSEYSDIIINRPEF